MRKLPAILVLLPLYIVMAVAQGPALHTVTIIVELPEGGLVTGAGTYVHGASVTVTAEPVPGYEFAGWWEEGVEVSPDPEYTFTITADRVLVARFVPVLFFTGTSFRSRGELELIPSVSSLSGYGELVNGYLYGDLKARLASRVSFKDTGLTSFSESLTLRRGNYRISSRVSFDPRGPSYRSSYLGFLARGSGYTLFGRLRHSAGGLHILGSVLSDGFNLRVSFVDEADSGLQFKSALLRLHGFSICCGLEASGTFSLTKQGFEYVKIKVRDLFGLCCRVSLDLTVEVTTDELNISLKPIWKYAEACLKVYGGPVWTGSAIEGFELHGFRIRCSLGGDRRYPRLEMVTAMAPEKLPWAGFQEEEFEYWDIRFRGTGCCGGKYEAGARFYFAHNGAAFGLSRVVIEGEVPLGILALRSEFTADLVGASTVFEVGWEIAF